MSARNLRLLQRDEKIESRDEKELSRRVTLLVRWYTAHTLTLKLRKTWKHSCTHILIQTQAYLHAAKFAHMHTLIHIHYYASFRSHIHMMAAGWPFAPMTHTIQCTSCDIMWTELEEEQMNQFEAKKNTEILNLWFERKSNRCFLRTQGCIIADIDWSSSCV